MALGALVVSFTFSGCGSKPSDSPADAGKPVVSKSVPASPATNTVLSAEEQLRLKAEAAKQETLMKREGMMMERRATKSMRIPLDESPASPAAPASALPEKSVVPSSSQAVPDPMQIR